MNCGRRAGIRMSGNSVESLSEAQRECLRLIATGLELKEVAREIGISPNAVVERLRNARRTLGVGTSREAARLFAAYERGADYMWHVATSDGVAERGPPAPFSRPSNNASRSAGEGPGSVSIREEQTPYLAAGLSAGARFPWPFPTVGRERNDLAGWQIFAAVLALTIGLGVAALVAIAMVDQLSQLRLG